MGGEKINDFVEPDSSYSADSGVKSNFKNQLFFENIKLDRVKADDIDDVGDTKNINFAEKNKINAESGISQELNSKIFFETKNKFISNSKKELNTKIDLNLDFSSSFPTNRELVVEGNKKFSSLKKKEVSQFEFPILTSSGSDQKSMIYGFRSWGSDHSVKVIVDSDWLGNSVKMQPSSSLVEHRLAQHSDISEKNHSTFHQPKDQDKEKNEKNLCPEEDEW